MCGLLPMQHLKMIFRQIFFSYIPVFREHIPKLDISTQRGKERLIQDINTLCKNLNSLKGVDPIDMQELISFIEEISAKQSSSLNFCDERQFRAIKVRYGNLL